MKLILAALALASTLATCGAEGPPETPPPPPPVEPLPVEPLPAEPGVMPSPEPAEPAEPGLVDTGPVALP